MDLDKIVEEYAEECKGIENTEEIKQKVSEIANRIENEEEFKNLKPEEKRQKINEVLKINYESKNKEEQKVSPTELLIYTKLADNTYQSEEERLNSKYPYDMIYKIISNGEEEIIEYIKGLDTKVHFLSQCYSTGIINQIIKYCFEYLDFNQEEIEQITKLSEWGAFDIDELLKRMFSKSSESSNMEIPIERLSNYTKAMDNFKKRTSGMCEKLLNLIINKYTNEEIRNIIFDFEKFKLSKTNVREELIERIKDKEILSTDDYIQILEKYRKNRKKDFYGYRSVLRDISRYNKEAIIKHFDLKPEDYRIEEEKMIDFQASDEYDGQSFAWGKLNGIMENEEWESEYHKAMMGFNNESEVHFYEYKLNQESILDFIGALKIINEYADAELEVEVSNSDNDTYYYGEWKQNQIDIPALLKSLGVEIVKKQNHDIEEVKETLTDEREGQVNDTTSELIEATEEEKDKSHDQ